MDQDLTTTEEIVFIRRIIRMGHSKGLTLPPYIVQLWQQLKGDVRKVKIIVKPDGTLIIIPLVTPL